MQRSERGRRSELRSRGGHFERVRFILAHFLDFFAGVIGANEERCLS